MIKNEKKEKRNRGNKRRKVMKEKLTKKRKRKKMQEQVLALEQELTHYWEEGMEKKMTKMIRTSNHNVKKKNQIENTILRKKNNRMKMMILKR